ncbi:MAG: hypothetical protein ACOC0B_02475 [bacterium]
MRRVIVLTAVMLLFAAVVAPAQEDDELVGDWTAYRSMDLSNYTLNDYRDPPAIEDLAEGVMTFEADGTVESDFLDYDEWELDEDFLVLSDGEVNAFYVPRMLSMDALYLLRVSVTERDREVTHIRVDRPGSYIVIRGDLE